MNSEIIAHVREKQPLIYHLTNQVVMNFTANGLLAFGASPIMAKSREEAAEMASIADGVLINIGTLTEADLQAMIIAGKIANERNIPVVLDPVGVAATSFRSQAVRKILNEVTPTIIKGNAGEMAFLADIPWQTKGVESIGVGNLEEVAAIVSRKYQTTAIVTGETDIIYSDETCIENHTGHPLLTKVTGAGCLLGSIITASLTTDHSLNEQMKTSLAFYGLAAEYAANHPNVNGPGTFMPHFLDALSFNEEQLKENYNDADK
ncbi:hydroxyethylthiazole kinase [Oceanobacillus sp. CAU 1775]